MRHRLQALVVPALILLALGASFPQGLCLMQRMESAQTDGAHDCCAKGIGAQPPACCHSDPTLRPKAVLASKVMAVVLTTTPATWSTPASLRDIHVAASASGHRPHSPPLTILRI